MRFVDRASVACAEQFPFAIAVPPIVDAFSSLLDSTPVVRGRVL